MTPPDTAPDPARWDTPRAAEDARPWRDALWAFALGLAAGAINLHAPTVFFDSQIMLGGTLVVFALLRFGWAGLLTGVLALGATALRWGHPFELIIGMLQYTWLLVFLQRFNDGWRNNDNGGVVVAAVGFWLLAGIWLEIALFHFVFGMPVREALALGLKECVVGIINAALGLLLFLLTRLVAPRKGEAAISARGATFAFTLTVAMLPSVLMIAVLSGQLRTVKLNSQLNELRYMGSRAADAYLSGGTQEPPVLRAGMACELLAGHRTLWSSDPAFFKELDASHVVDSSRIPDREDLAILKPREGGPVIKADRNSYWQAFFKVPGRDGPLTVRVTQQAAILISQIDYDLIVPAFSVLLALLVLGVGVSALAARAVGRSFDQILRPDAGGSVRNAGIRELDDVMQLAGGTREAREALQASERRYRNFFNLPLVGTAISSRTKGWIEVNDRTCEILGYPREELFQKTWADITHPDDLAADEAQFERMLRREIDGYQLEKRFVRKDGTIVYTLLAGGCGPIGDKTPDTFYVNLLDITERKQLEEELRRSEERHRLLADNAADVINVIDLSGRLLYVSPSVEKLIGYTQEEALKLSVEDILVPEAAAGARAGLEATAAAIAAGAPLPEFQGEFPHRHKDGSTVWAEATSTCMVDKDGKYVATLVVTRNISERKRLEAELDAAREREKLAEQKMRATLEQKLKTSLNAAAVAHEINQPLSRILLRARLDLEKETGAGKETLSALIEDAERVVNTIEKMKVLLRNVETVQQPVNLAEVVRSSLHHLKQPLRRGQIKVAHTGPEESCRVLGDDVQLQMIATNLLRNAIEAITGSDSPRREISIERVPHRDTVELVIGDSGPGWPGDTLDEVLLRTTKREGSGIGLYIVKTALENHRGQITIGSSPLGGAEFRITFPRVSEGSANL